MRLTSAQARQRFGIAVVARLATVSPAGTPHLVPFTFALAGDVIYTAVDAKPKSTKDLQRLRNIAANPLVAVLADHYADDWSQLWWARADGEASVITDPADLAAPIATLAARYRQYLDQPPGGPVIAIQVSRWTGWSAS